MEFTRVNISMTTQFHKKLKEEAAKRGMSVSEYIRYAINRLWDSKGE